MGNRLIFYYLCILHQECRKKLDCCTFAVAKIMAILIFASVKITHTLGHLLYNKFKQTNK